ncbi:SDR family oxidoreductase [Bacillus thuringiensis]|uniref:SDR family oxidoreductase n=1 Tax=Bacillus thuringiensis TaxID=1428 RepID=UPI000E514FA3|nr:SDR family oxidoreductase [Bacillus thuringiensis]MDZ3956917.1 SDR family oxidoreductase [Bacillus thuringiensis]RGP42342.1 hypothetical protein BTW32_31245 [Bacillus thuringiensis]
MYKNIFITGGSGMLGSAVIQDFQQNYNLYCLVHRKVLQDTSLKSVKGNIQLPKLGLQDAEYEKICEEIDLVIHMAAITNFNKEVKDTNVEGTKNMLQLAKDANVPLYYISTAYVYSFNENEAYITKGNEYEQSKIEAEKIVKSSGVPYTIIRPSIILGDSKTGEVAHYQGFHYMIKLLLQKKLPIIPGNEQAKLDCVPQDYVAKVISGLVKKQHVGGEYYVTLGENAPILAELKIAVVDNAQKINGTDLKPPKLIGGEIFNRLFRPLLPKLPINDEMKGVLSMVKYINITGTLPSSIEFFEKELGITEHPDIHTVIYNNMKYLIEKEFSSSPKEKV